MKSTIIPVVSKEFPKHGRFIAEGSYEYFVTPDGLPAMRFRWQGMMFPGPKAVFVFSRDALKIGRITDDTARSKSRWSGFFNRSNVAGGLLVGVVSGAIGAATAPTTDIKGFTVSYNNEDGHLGSFLAIASPQVVDQILESVPKENQIEDTPPTEPPPTRS